MTSIEIRDLTADDDALVLQLDKEFQANASSEPDDEPDSAAEMLLLLPQHRGMALAATVDSEPAGYAVVGPRNSGFGIDHASEARVLNNIAVLPQHRGKGVGSALLARVTARAKRAGLSLLIAHVPENLIPFYEGQGWTVGAQAEGVAWIEEPSTRLWDELLKIGAPLTGPRRKLAVLRHDGQDDDPLYPHIAYIVLNPKKVVQVFSVPVTPAPENLRPHLLIATMRTRDPANYAKLPKDVRDNADEAIRYSLQNQQK